MKQMLKYEIALNGCIPDSLIGFFPQATCILPMPSSLRRMWRFSV